MNHPHASDSRSLVLGLGSWFVGQVVQVPTLPLFMLVIALLTPAFSRLGDRIADRLLGPAHKP